jgi:hypothetical protein
MTFVVKVYGAALSTLYRVETENHAQAERMFDAFIQHCEHANEPGEVVLIGGDLGRRTRLRSHSVGPQRSARHNEWLNVPIATPPIIAYSNNTTTGNYITGPQYTITHNGTISSGSWLNNPSYYTTA